MKKIVGLTELASLLQGTPFLSPFNDYATRLNSAVTEAERRNYLAKINEVISPMNVAIDTEKILASMPQLAEIIKPKVYVAPAQLQSVGSYRLIIDLSLEGIALDEYQKNILGSAAEKILNNFILSKQQFTLPIANRRMSLLAFASTEPVPIVSRQWTIDFELLEFPVDIEAIVSGFASLTGMQRSYFTLNSINEISVEGGSSMSSTAVLVVLAVSGLLLYKFGK
jgi:hypothetical protein